MLAGDCCQRAAKWPLATKPLIDHYAQGVLVTGRSRLALYLLGCHIGDGSSGLQYLLRVSTLGEDSQAKVTQQNFIVSPQQHVLRLDVAVDDAFVMRIL